MNDHIDKGITQNYWGSMSVKKMNAEQKLLKQIEQLGGKVKYRHIHGLDIIPIISGIIRSGTYTEATIIIGEQEFKGKATKHPKDNFCKYKGRVMALGRAYSNYLKTRPLTVDEFAEAATKLAQTGILMEDALTTLDKVLDETVTARTALEKEVEELGNNVNELVQEE